MVVDAALGTHSDQGRASCTLTGLKEQQSLHEDSQLRRKLWVIHVQVLFWAHSSAFIVTNKVFLKHSYHASRIDGYISFFCVYKASESPFAAALESANVLPRGNYRQTQGFFFFWPAV